MFLIRGMVVVVALLLVVAVIFTVIQLLSLLPAWAGFLVIFIAASALIGLLISDDY
jgi:ABC-type multidrug transport system permease subunit